MSLANKDGIGQILFRGKKVLEQVQEHVVSAAVDMSVDLVTQLQFTIEDPGFTILKRGLFDVGTPVTYRGLKLMVSVIETTDGGGMGGLTVSCRPVAVSKLKNLRTKRVVTNMSPTEFLISDCTALGLPYVAQPSDKKKQIARDQPEKGQEYDNTNHPSAWTTFQRLATDLGYMFYESNGTIYFGKPTWLVERAPKFQIVWYASNGKEPLTIPKFRKSDDSKDIELSLDVPLERIGDVYPGYGVIVTDFPYFAGTYLVKTVTYPLAGPGVVAITASTVRNPKVQKSGEQSE